MILEKAKTDEDKFKILMNNLEMTMRKVQELDTKLDEIAGRTNEISNRLASHIHTVSLHSGDFKRNIS